MTQLADYVDSGVRFMLERTNDSIGSDAGGPSRALLNQLQRLANDTNALRELAASNDTMSSYDLTRRVNVLLRDARNVNGRIRRVPATRDVWDDWSAVVDGVNRLQRLAAGYDVSVPQPRAEWASGGYDNGGYGNGGYDNGRYGRDQDRDGTYRDDHYAYPRTSDVGGYRSDALTGTRLSEFRRLAHDLDVYATRAHEQAEANGLATDQTRERFLENLHHFADDTSALHQKSDAGQLLPSDLGPTVSHLLTDAREVDRSMRQAGADRNVWDDWQRVMSSLQRMDDLLRR